MKIKTLKLEKFKKVDEVALKLDSINVLVGGNNAGKSSVLQGIHFSLVAAIASREAGRDTFTQDSLLYCPARAFESLRHGSAYLNQSKFGFLRLEGDVPEEANAKYTIKIYRGRNEGNVGCQRSGSWRVANILSNSERLFSIYVPGLAGVSQGEQFRTESVVRRGVASGDANLYLRNVLLLIKKKNRLNALRDRMRSVFPKFAISVNFNEARDVFIDVRVSTQGENVGWCPLEVAGTGVQQALQIFSYVTLFEPTLLLLDEPDSHLHPDNQALLANALQVAARDTGTQILLATHSRHLVDSLYDEANFVWLREGKVFKQGPAIDRLPLLMDLGALDRFDRLLNGNVPWVFLTEDRKNVMLDKLLERAGFPKDQVLTISYKTSTNLEAAKLLAGFIKDVAADTKVVIHRDRDFMTAEEVSKVETGIRDAGAIPFITDGSDLECYFVNSAHAAQLLNVGPQEVEDWLSALALAEHIQLQHSFTRKRDDIKHSLYRGKLDQCPDTQALLGVAVPLPPPLRKGKTMMKLMREGMTAKFGKSIDLLQGTPHLGAPRLEAIRANQA